MARKKPWYRRVASYLWEHRLSFVLWMLFWGLVEAKYDRFMLEREVSKLSAAMAEQYRIDAQLIEEIIRLKETM